MTPRHFKIGRVIAIIFFSAFAADTPAQSQDAQRSELAKYAEAEKFVLEKITAGHIANLEQKFKDNPEKRVISANFLMALLLNPDKANVHRNGVNIIGARIVGEIDMNNVEIERFVYLEKCQFDDVYFFQTIFKKGLWIRGSTFQGAVVFRHATVMHLLTADDVKFTKESQFLNFENLTVNGPAILNRTSFAGPVSFQSLKVKGHISFTDGTFAGPVTFFSAEFDGSFDVSKAQFLCKETVGQPCRETQVSFNSMRIGNAFLAEGAVFERPVSLLYVTASSSFQGSNTTFKKDVSFPGSTFGGTLFLKGATFSGAADLRGVNVAINIMLDSARFEGEEPALFQHTTANNIFLNNTTFSRPPNLSNLTYQSISPRDGILDLIKNSDSDYSAYVEFEKFLQKSGFSSHADEVFMEMKKYERRKGMNWFDSIKSYLSQALQGFGRRPHRVLYYDLAVLLVGAVLFRRRNMTLKPVASKEQEAEPDGKRSPPYNAFLYSLTLFAPAIDTQYTNNWEPKEKHQRVRWYMQAHKVMGYVLVPLTIAIWTGIFK